jgi:hypothetical protein
MSDFGTRRAASNFPWRIGRVTYWVSRCVGARRVSLRPCSRRSLLRWVAALAFAACSNAHATVCGASSYPFPFTDVGGVADGFCRGIVEAYVLGVTAGTTPTTFSPNNGVTRVQMTTFLQRSIDQGLRRSSRRMALGQWWTPKTGLALQRVRLDSPGLPSFCKADGEDIWVANGTGIARIRASTGQTQADYVVSGLGITDVKGMLVANGLVFAVAPGSSRFVVIELRVDAVPSKQIRLPEPVSYHPNSLAFDGDRIWTANYVDGSISIITGFLDSGILIPPGTVIGGFASPIDVIFDGSNIWVAEATANRIRKLNAMGAALQTVAVGASPAYMVYDGANIWVPNYLGDSLTVVRASTGEVIATISGDASNGLSKPVQVAFDGERILVTNQGNDSVTLFRAADLTLIGNVQLDSGAAPYGVCSDGINFWITLRGSGELLRL